ncbi:hypothetical protein R6Q57_015511 [Mikania cordata]
MDDGIKTTLLRHEVEEEGDLKQRVWEESKKIWRVALPGVISRVGAFGTIVVTQSFIGHISGVDLAGYALVQTLSVRFVNGILLGMSSATETLCGQAFGAGQHHMMGIYLQRSWIVDLITLTVLLPIFIFGAQIFKLIGEEESIAKSAGYMSLWFIPFVYNFVFSLTMQMYLQAQLKNMIIAWLSVLQFVIHIPLSLLFVYKLNMGISGAMIALSMSSWALVIGEFIYVFGGWCPHSWKGFTVAAFKDLVPVVKMSLSSGLMVCLELWYYALLVLLAGYMADAEVAISAFSICLNINAWEFMISLGFLGAACVRVANELGRGNAKAVRFSIKVLLGTSITVGVFFFALCLAFGKKLAYLFTDDDRVANTVSDLSLLLSFSVLLNSIYPVLSGVAVGAGLQSAVAIVNLVCFYIIGIPVGALLGYLTSLQVKGIWIGMIGGVLTQTITLVYMTWRTDWDDQVNNMIIAWLSGFQFTIHICLSLLFVYKLNMGTSGAMLALSMSSWFLVIGEFIYIFGGWCPHSWKGFTVAAFKDLIPVVKLSISSGVMLCLELWYNAILVLLAGYMADAEVAISAFSICLNVNLWEFMIGLGFLSAACVRVANEFGRGNAKAVKFSIKVLLGTSISIGVFFFVLCLFFHKKLAYLFTDDDRVADTVSDLSLLLSFSVLLNSIYPILSGVAIGAGMQATVAFINLICYYIIGIPLGVLLGYLTSLQVKVIVSFMFLLNAVFS